MRREKVVPRVITDIAFKVCHNTRPWISALLKELQGFASV